MREVNNLFSEQVLQVICTIVKINVKMPHEMETLFSAQVCILRRAVNKIKFCEIMVLLTN